jgi:hypothetical protein
MSDNINPYLTHIGNCGAVNSSPDDERCICGLRQTYFKMQASKKERIKEVVGKSTSEGYKPKSKEEKIELKGD